MAPILSINVYNQLFVFFLVVFFFYLGENKFQVVWEICVSTAPKNSGNWARGTVVKHQRLVRAQDDEQQMF